MSPYNHWDHTLFNKILISYCNEFLESSDQVPKRTRLKLITKVLNEIADIVKELKDASLPDDLEKVIPICNMNVKDIDLHVQCVWTWFSNYTSANAKKGKVAKDTYGHWTSSNAWMANQFVAIFTWTEFLRSRKHFLKMEKRYRRISCCLSKHI